MNVEPRLTTLAHGGGCGCKLAPAALRAILGGLPAAAPFANLLVGTETSDDAAVWRLNVNQALVATTDFFMPVVDDPFDFGRIAAANALSDIYAMGARPIMALAIVGMPIARLSAATIGRILEGGAAIAAEAGIPIAGGHSIDSVEPIYGLVALGLAHPAAIRTNAGARDGDVLILTKALGVGILSAAFKTGTLQADGYAALLDSTTRLNDVGPALAQLPGVHAITDVTGFGLVGHALEMAAGSGCAVELSASAPALLPHVAGHLAAGVRTGASARNWDSYGGQVLSMSPLDTLVQTLLSDPQTSGGLLIAVAPDDAARVEALALDAGFEATRRVGRVQAGPPMVHIVP